MTTSATTDRHPWVVFLIFLRLGLTSFGGPVAHLGFFRDEFVTRRGWLSERSYAELVALCQFLPGASSSQTGMALGLVRAGYKGALAAWAGFTLPSAVALILFALGMNRYGYVVPPGVLHGFKVVAVAVVARAVWGMGRHLCPDIPRLLIMLVVAAFVLLIPSSWAQVAAIALAALAGLLCHRPEPTLAEAASPQVIRRRAGVVFLAVFFLLLVGLPIASAIYPAQWLAMVDAFYRTGSLVFGGGHVVLPLLQAEVVPKGWVDNESFLAGYGLTQAVPGPLFTFSAFLGASAQGSVSGWAGGMVCLLAIFAPSFLLIAGVWPFWQRLRGNGFIRSALWGINAAVVGLLLAALYQPVWTSAIGGWPDIALAGLALLALGPGKLPPWLVVAGSGLAGWGLALLPG